MRMAENQFVRQLVTHVCYIKIPRLTGNLGIETHVQQHVTQLLANVFLVVFHQGVTQLKGFLYRVRPQTLVRLFPVPRTLFAQRIQHVEETPESL